MKKIILIILLFSFFNGLTQSLSEKEILKLNKLNIKTESLNINNFNIQNDLNRILKLEKKRKTNKTVGIVLTSLSVSSMIFGGIFVSKGNATIDAYGATMIAVGVFYGGVSIPFWVSSKKRKRERNELIKMFDN